MLLESVKLHNFRCSKDEEILFCDGVNLLYGKNAQGKTNMLEAIYFFARGKSFRAARDFDMLRFGEKDFSLEITFLSGGKKQSLAFRYADGARARFANGVKVSAKEQIGRFNAVFFYPDHLSILKNAPADRREFLNIALSQFSPAYLADLAAHKKLTDQKNSLLKQGEFCDTVMLNVYNEQLAVLSRNIYLARRAYVKKLQKHAAQIIDEISRGKENVSILYQSDMTGDLSDPEEVESAYKRLFDKMKVREIEAGICLCGIRRDDLLFTVNGKDARLFASQGQQRSIALALKIAEGEILTEERGEAPVYLFDDVLGELDGERKAYILSKTQDRQTIVTDCDAALYTSLPSVHRIFAENGSYQSQE